MKLSELSTIIRVSPFAPDAILEATGRLEASGFNPDQILEVIPFALRVVVTQGGNSADFRNLIHGTCHVAESMGIHSAMSMIRGDVPDMAAYG